MQEISGWLSSLGLSEYVERFAENRIDFRVLPDLTDQDLKELGIVLGDRRKIIRAIRELGATPIPRAANAPEAPTMKEHQTRDAAERRQLTVMLCDLVESTALSARLDPEGLRGIIGAYHRCATDLVERHGGFVAKYMGDGVLAYFGYPKAHEHDAERAIRAGLAVVEAVPKLATNVGCRRYRCALGLQLGWSSSATYSGKGLPKNRRLSVRHQTWRHGFRGWLSQTAS